MYEWGSDPGGEGRKEREEREEERNGERWKGWKWNGEEEEPRD